MNKYGTTPTKFTQAHVLQNMDHVAGKHEREGGFAHKPNNEFYDWA
jgi:hypothetical protein